MTAQDMIARCNAVIKRIDAAIAANEAATREVDEIQEKIAANKARIAKTMREGEEYWAQFK